MNLYFKNSQGQERLIAQPNTIKEMNQEINKFLEEHNFKLCYLRQWYVPEENRTYIDVGSWSEYFTVDCDLFNFMKQMEK